MSAKVATPAVAVAVVVPPRTTFVPGLVSVVMANKTSFVPEPTSVVQLSWIETVKLANAPPAAEDVTTPGTDKDEAIPLPMLEKATERTVMALPIPGVENCS
jgi:hypothetical protein